MPTAPPLLTRDAFRDEVFARDGYACVICKEPAADAHHIIERRLFPDGGYYLDNGASLCAGHHLAAESTALTCEQVREAAGITAVILPPDLYSDTRYDKWGNPYINDGLRAAGPIFYDQSVQKVIKGDFSRHVKYPRTFHLPWSPGKTKDDRVMSGVEALLGVPLIITEKMDGENTTFYQDGLHARSLDYEPHPSRDRIKALHASIAHDIPAGWRICGENIYAKHSILYEDLPAYFLVFSIWNEHNECLSWDETLEWCELLGLETVPVLWERPFETANAFEVVMRRLLLASGHETEGYVVRPRARFQLRDFSKLVGKYVREGHVASSHHWRFEKVTLNLLRN